MGGLALKNCFTRRASRSEFDEISSIVKNKMLTLFTMVDIPLFYKTKDSFGDIDIICANDNIISNFDFYNWILDTFKSKEIFHNTNVWSFEFMQIQIDMIITPEENFDSSVTYYSWNDCSNLIGRYAHRFGLKYGFDGLCYVYRHEDKVLGEITVSKDIKEILDFLGLDHSRYARGFESLTDIFDFIAAGKYFDPFMYDMNTLNRINRERNEKRKTYQEFLKYVEPLKATVTPYVYNKNKQVYIGLIDRYFPGFMAQYLDLTAKEARRVAIHDKFNGHIIMEHYPHLSGKELGNAITAFRSGFLDQSAYEDYVLSNETETILNRFATELQLNNIIS